MSFKDMLPCFYKYKHWHVWFFFSNPLICHMCFLPFCVACQVFCVSLCILWTSDNENGNRKKAWQFNEAWITYALPRESHAFSSESVLPLPAPEARGMM